jgi:cardiolipin synthase
VIALLISRDLILGILTLGLKSRGLATLPVSYLGKAATFNLLYAFPLLLLALSDSNAGRIAYVVGWSFAIWGIALYLTTGASYFRAGILAIKAKSIKVIP